MTSNLLQASAQWASRPADERFLSLPELHRATYDAFRASKTVCVSNRAIEARPDPDNALRGIVVVGPNGAPVTPTHWAFGQLAQRAGAPAGYLRDLPAPLAADCINYGLKCNRSVDELGILLRRPITRAVEAATPGDDFNALLAKPVSKPAPLATLAAVTGPNYGRVWNHEIVKALIDKYGDGVTGDFRVPGVHGQRVEVTTENTTLYASDRDMFVFLADEEHRIECPNRRGGRPGALARGFFVWNSEVGAGTLGIATFLFDYVCGNRIVWGAEGFQEIRVRHTSGAPDRWLEEIAPAIRRYAHSSTEGITTLVAAAKAKRIGDDDTVREFLSKRFSRSQAGSIMAAHKTDEGRPIETLWDAVTGATAYARGLQYQDSRVELEREAGKILGMAR